MAEGPTNPGGAFPPHGSPGGMAPQQPGAPQPHAAPPAQPGAPGAPAGAPPQAAPAGPAAAPAQASAPPHQAPPQQPIPGTEPPPGMPGAAPAAVPAPAAAPAAAPEPATPPSGEAVDPEAVPEDAPKTIAALLVGYDGNPLGDVWPIRQGANVVGRKEAMEGLDVEIDHPTTSSRHAVLLASARPGRVKLEDVGSTNGTFLNGEKIPPNQKHELKDGDEVRFGGFNVTLKIV